MPGRSFSASRITRAARATISRERRSKIRERADAVTAVITDRPQTNTPIATGRKQQGYAGYGGGYLWGMAGSVPHPNQSGRPALLQAESVGRKRNSRPPASDLGSAGWGRAGEFETTLSTVSMSAACVSDSGGLRALNYQAWSRALKCRAEKLPPWGPPECGGCQDQ
jgi:hypothetical protein